MKLSHWISGAAAAALLLVGAGWSLADGDSSTKKPKNSAAFSTLHSLDLKEAQAKAKDWFKYDSRDAAAKKAFDDIWTADGPVLTKVTATLVLGDPAAKKLLDEASNPKASAPTEVPSLVKDRKLDPFFRANLALAYAKALSNRRIYEEALEALETVKPEQVVDPARILFHRRWPSSR